MSHSVSRMQRALRMLVGGASIGGLGAFARTRTRRSSERLADAEARHGNELTALRMQIAEAETERQRVIWRMNRAVEEERRRLASELHRRPLQELTGVGYQLERVSMALGRGDAEAAAEIIDEASTNLTRQLEAIRVIMTDLRPPILDQHGLAGALEGIKARFFRDHPDIELRLSGHQTRLGTETETAFYRVAQESLNNVVRHANASQITVTINADDDSAEMQVADDGDGFDTTIIDDLDPIHTGIVAMQDRMAMIDGTITFESGVSGTVVTCRAPRADLTAFFENELLV